MRKRAATIPQRTLRSPVRGLCFDWVPSSQVSGGGRILCVSLNQSVIIGMMYGILGVGIGNMNTASCRIGSLQDASRERGPAGGAWGDEGWADLIREGHSSDSEVTDGIVSDCNNL